jgi:uncharacterized membrane protein
MRRGVAAVLAVVVLLLAAAAGLGAAAAVEQRPRPWRASVLVQLTAGPSPTVARDELLTRGQHRYAAIARRPAFTLQVVKLARVSVTSLRGRVGVAEEGVDRLRLSVSAEKPAEARVGAEAAAASLAELIRGVERGAARSPHDQLDVITSSGGPTRKLAASKAVVAGASGLAGGAVVLVVIGLALAARKVDPEAARRAPGSVHRRWPVLGSITLVALANVVVLQDARVPYVTPALGFFALLGAPTFLLYGANLGRWVGAVERLATSFLAALLIAMVSGLFVSVAGPPVQVLHPLSTGGVLVTGDLVLLALLMATYGRHPIRWVLPRVSLNAPEALLLTLSALAVILAVAGAIRLDNGLGGGLTHATLAFVVVLFGLLFAWRNRLSGATTYATAYGLSLVLLLMTSLRGDFASGHDIQHEMFVFHNTLAAGVYDPQVPDGYNACLSITVLPTLLARWTQVFDPYVYKVFFQLLYALCPVIVLGLVSRLAGRAVALVSFIWFVGFLGFLQDMPMLNRQEIGFLFFAGALLCLFADDAPLSVRRGWFCVLSVGMVLSHYSTTYFAIGALCATYALQVLLRTLLRLSARRRRRKPDRAEPRLALLLVDRTRRWPITFALVLFLATASAIWTNPVTHTAYGLTKTVTSTIAAIRGTEEGPRSGEAQFTVLPIAKGKAKTAETAFAKVRGQVIALRQTAPASFYDDAPLPGDIATGEVRQPELPLSWLGEDVKRLGLDVSAFNRATRVGSAILLQLVLFAGALITLFARRRLPMSQVEPVLMGFGLLVITAAQLVVPVLSLDYGVGRSFMQSLMVLGPFLTIGSAVLLRGRVRRFGAAAGAALAMLFFVSASGVITQALGGYAPQLHLNASGEYYDRYYVTRSEFQTLSWFTNAVAAPAGLNYPDLQVDPVLFNKARSITPRDHPLAAFISIDPGAVRKDAYVMLGSVNVRDHKTELTVDGFALWFDYSMPFLDAHKNLVFATEDTRVYR